MIDNLFFILQVIGVVILIGWVVVNDGLAEGALSRGPLAFKQADRSKNSPARASRHRQGSARLSGHRDEGEDSER